MQFANCITFFHISIKYLQSTKAISDFIHQTKFSENKYWSNQGDIYLHNMPLNYRQQPYGTSERRKRKRKKTKSVFRTPDKDPIKIYGVRSWFDQNEIESKLTGSGLVNCSTSEKKLCKWRNSFNFKSSEENSDSKIELYIDNDEVPGVKQWVIHLDNFSDYLKSFCICKYYSG